MLLGVEYRIRCSTCVYMYGEEGEERNERGAEGGKKKGGRKGRGREEEERERGTRQGRGREGGRGGGREEGGVHEPLPVIKRGKASSTLYSKALVAQSTGCGVCVVPRGVAVSLRHWGSCHHICFRLRLIRDNL